MLVDTGFGRDEGSTPTFYANPFQTTSSAFIITDVAIEASAFGGPGDYGFNAFIYNSNGTSPAFVEEALGPRTLTVPTGQIRSTQIFTWTPNTTLQPNTLYFLALQPDPQSGWEVSDFSNPVGNPPPPSGGRWRFDTGTNTWVSASGYNAYQIQAAPAPSPAAGLLPVALVLSRYRKRYRSLQQGASRTDAS